MLKFVTLILLSISIAMAMAQPGRRGLPPKKCERILVSEDKEAEVTELGCQVAEMRGRYKLMMDILSAPASEIRLVADEAQLVTIQDQLVEMEANLADIRSNYTKSVENVESGIARLRQLLSEYSPSIQAGLMVAPPAPEGPRPHGFMKREIFKAFPDLADLPPGAISEELSGRQMGDQHPNPSQPQPDRRRHQQQQQQQAQPDIENGFTCRWPPRMKP